MELGVQQLELDNRATKKHTTSKKLTTIYNKHNKIADLVTLYETQSGNAVAQICSTNFGCHPGIQGPPRLRTVVPWPVHLRCRPSKLPRTSLFLQRLPHSVSSSPLHCYQPSIFGWRPSDVELPATGGYVGTVSCDLPHSTRDVPVHGVISRCSNSSDIYSTHCR